MTGARLRGALTQFPGVRVDRALQSPPDRSWRIALLGSDTPIGTIADAVAKLGPDAVVLAAVTPEPFEAGADEIRSLAGGTPVLIGGGGAGAKLATRLGATALEPDPVTAAAGMPGS